jgi:hypothetical protein
MRKAIIPCLAAFTLATAAAAQEPMRAELRPLIGAYVPTGDQRDAFKDAFVFGVQAGLELTRAFHVVATVGWVPGKSLLTTSARGVDVLQFDAGVEYNWYQETATGWVFRPFVGLGAGGRTYDYEAPAFETATFFDGYGALGLEFQLGKVSVRAEGRDYVSRFRAPTPGASSATRNDLTVALGVAYHFGPW